MAWCDACSSYRAPTALIDGHTCASCGGEVDAEHDGGERRVGAGAPWHFWLVVALLAAYLLWRLIVFVIWLF